MTNLFDLVLFLPVRALFLFFFPTALHDVACGVRVTVHFIQAVTTCKLKRLFTVTLSGVFFYVLLFARSAVFYVSVWVIHHDVFTENCRHRSAPTRARMC